jgi:crotonobetainyl-CoA:carnitine CoA-transferase CaiB-like acyl-CoA transferase
MKAMGFEYEQLKALNPGIILVSVSGFGQYGPYTDRPAFDPLGQAMSGLMSLTGKPVGKMSKTPGQIGPVPTHGQHTDEVLGRLLGYDSDTLGQLRRSGVIA